MPNETLQFLQRVHSQTIELGQMIQISTLEPGQVFKSHCFKSLEQAATAAQKAADAADVYFRAAGLKTPPRGRGAASCSSSIPGLWMDIDIAGPGHSSGKSLPPSIETAGEVLSGAGLPPTLRVHSGHGLQVWWLFKEPWDFNEDEKEREAAGRLCEQWARSVAATFHAASYGCDSVFDLARVMRLPGTWNRKAEPVPVLLLPDEGPEYNPDDFEPFLYLNPMPGVSPAIVEVDNVRLDPNVRLDVVKLDALLENDEDFRRTWRRERREKWSPSEYHLSLSSQLVRCGWSDQEIADTMITWQRKFHPEAMDKILRPDYMRKYVIGKSRSGFQEGEAIVSLSTAETPTDVYSGLQSVLGFPVTGIVQYGLENAAYEIQASINGEPRTIRFNSIRELRSQMSFGDRIAETVRRNWKTLKGPAWDSVLQSIFNVMEVKRIVDSEDAVETGQWLEHYLDENKPKTKAGWKTAFMKGLPYEIEIEGEMTLSLYADDFRLWVDRVYQVRQTRRDICRRLTRIGFAQAAVTVRMDNESIVCRSRWTRKKS